MVCFKKVMDCVMVVIVYIEWIVKVVVDFVGSGFEVSYLFLEGWVELKLVMLFVLLVNCGFCGGYNGNVLRMVMG